MVNDFNVIDTTKVNLDLLKSKVNFTLEIREIMLNDAIFYLGINARNKQILKSVENEILSMIELLNSKCQEPND
jgi:hypothetical protein